jgi:hypothetical protein
MELGDIALNLYDELLSALCQFGIGIVVLEVNWDGVQPVDNITVIKITVWIYSSIDTDENVWR